MKPILLFIAKHLIAIHKGTLTAKLKSTAILSVSASPFALLLDKLEIWARANIEFMAMVVVAILIDHFVGTILHAFVRKDFSWGKNIKGFVLKMAVCTFGYALAAMMVNVVKDIDIVATWLTVAFNIALFLYPAGSAFMNLSEITGGVFPPLAWIEKIKKFQHSGQVEDLKDKE